jgi:hypothetical protein
MAKEPKKEEVKKPSKKEGAQGGAKKEAAPAAPKKEETSQRDETPKAAKPAKTVDARLKLVYKDRVVPALVKEFGY